MKRSLYAIGSASGIAGNNPGTSLGPIVLQGSQLLQPYHLHWQQMCYAKPSKPKLEAMQAVAELNQCIAEQTFQLTQNGKFWITFGGDQSCAIGAWSGPAAAMRNEGPIGLIWIDAHMDSHTPETSKTGNIHGMPLACLLGYGDAALTHLMDGQPKLLPQRLCLIGTRSFEPEEAELLQRLKVRVFHMDEVLKRGMDVIMAEALAIVTHGTAGYGISIDLDAIDPSEAPGVGVPVPGGISTQALCNSLTQSYNDQRLLGLEISEFNPNLDHNQTTEKLITQLMSSLFEDRT